MFPFESEKGDRLCVTDFFMWKKLVPGSHLAKSSPRGLSRSQDDRTGWIGSSNWYVLRIPKRVGLTIKESRSIALELKFWTAAYACTKHPDFSKLAARISISNLHKQTKDSFAETTQILREHRHPKVGTSCSGIHIIVLLQHRTYTLHCLFQTNAPAPLVSEEVNDIVQRNKERLDAAIVHERDFE